MKKACLILLYCAVALAKEEASSAATQTENPLSGAKDDLVTLYEDSSQVGKDLQAALESAQEDDTITLDEQKELDQLTSEWISNTEMNSEDYQAAISDVKDSAITFLAPTL